MAHHVLMKLREATADDFANQFGEKRIGTMYFQQNFNGSVCTQPFYFTEQTNLETFRELYTSKQILVPVRIFDPIEVVSETEKELTN